MRIPYLGVIIVNTMPELTGLHLILDPGHGGGDRGFTDSGGLTEAPWTLRVTELLRERCEALGATVAMTRTEDTFVPQLLRRALIYEIRPDIAISLHLGEAPSQGTGTVSIGYRWWQAKSAGPLRQHLLYAVERALPFQPERSSRLHATRCRIPSAPVRTRLIGITACPPGTSLETDTFEPALWADALTEGLRLYCRNQPAARSMVGTTTVEASVAAVHPPSPVAAVATPTARSTPSPLPLIPGVRMPLAGAPVRVALNYHPPSSSPMERTDRIGTK